MAKKTNSYIRLLKAKRAYCKSGNKKTFNAAVKKYEKSAKKSGKTNAAIKKVVTRVKNMGCSV